MPNSDARVVRGLSIAVLTLSILAIAGSLIGFAFLALGGAALNDPSVIAELERNTAIHGTVNGQNLSASDAAGLATIGLGVFGFGLIWATVCSIITLIASILGMRNYDKTEKLGSAFGWAIAGAIAAFLTGRLITTILLVVAAVYISKVRKAPAVPYGQPVYAQPYQQPGYLQQPYQQAVPTPPVPQASPAQPYQQPSQDAQPQTPDDRQ